MQPCAQPCLDCPFRRDATPEKTPWGETFTFVPKYFTQNERFEFYECPEQGDICYGQIQMLSNSNMDAMIDPFTDLFDWVRERPKDRKNYFWGPSEMAWYHMTNGRLYSAKDYNRWKHLLGFTEDKDRLEHIGKPAQQEMDF